MKLEEITILHLSDLHFGGNASELIYTDLLSDIEAVLQNVKKLIILVSGDFVFQGVYKTNAGKAKSFFKKLKKCLDRIVEIASDSFKTIVPTSSMTDDNLKIYMQVLYNAGVTLVMRD